MLMLKKLFADFGVHLDCADRDGHDWLHIRVNNTLLNHFTHSPLRAILHLLLPSISL